MFDKEAISQHVDSRMNDGSITAEDLEILVAVVNNPTRGKLNRWYFQINDNVTYQLRLVREIRRHNGGVFDSEQYKRIMRIRLVFSHDGHHIITAFIDNTIRLGNERRGGVLP